MRNKMACYMLSKNINKNTVLYSVLFLSNFKCVSFFSRTLYKVLLNFFIAFQIVSNYCTCKCECLSNNKISVDVVELKCMQKMLYGPIKTCRYHWRIVDIAKSI